jgi:hypothetical protein
MGLHAFQWPLLVLSILSLCALVGSFIIGFWPKRMGQRQAVVWSLSLLLSPIAFFVGYVSLILELPEYQRGSTTVVWGTYAMNFFGHSLVCAGVMIVSFPRLRHIMPPPLLFAVVNACMGFGVITPDSSKRWYFLGFTLLFYIAALLAMFLPYFGIGSGDRAPAVSSKKSTSGKRLAFQIIIAVVQALSILVFILEPAMGHVIGRALANLLFALINLAVMIFAFLLFVMFKPDSDPEVGRFVSGKGNNDDADYDEAPASDDEGADEEARPPADQAPKAGAMFGATRNTNFKLFA